MKMAIRNTRSSKGGFHSIYLSVIVALESLMGRSALLHLCNRLIPLLYTVIDKARARLGRALGPSAEL